MTVEDVNVLLEQVASLAATETSDASRQTCTYLTDGLMNDGTLYDGAYAALPYLVEAAAALPPGQTSGFWVDLGFIVTAEDRPPIPADLEAGFNAALRLAEWAAVKSLLASGHPAELCAHLALCCVAFARHHTATALWRFLEPQQKELVLLCPGCGSDTEITDFFVDPVRPSSEAPGPPDPACVREGDHPWRAMAAALQEEALGEGWEPFLRAARAVAAAGVRPETPGQAVLCLVAALVAVKGVPQSAGREWARKLMLLTGHFRCWDCEQTWTIADGLTENPDGARPHTDVGGEWTASDGAAGTMESTAAGRTGEAATRFRQDGNTLRTADGTPWGRIAVFADAPSSFGGVNSLTVVSGPGQPALVAGAGDGGVVWLWEVANGTLVQGPLAGHPDRICSLTAVPLPDGRVLVASGGDTGTIAVWNPATGRPVREPAGNWPGGVTGMCTASTTDGRTLLVTATPRGSVRTWDPVTGEPVGRLNPYGSQIQSIAAIPISAGHTLIAASDTAGRLHVWDPAVDDPWDPGAAVQLSARALHDADHRVAAVAAVPTRDRTVLATGDNAGVIMLWDPATGAPIGDSLPSSTGTAGLPLIAAATPHDGRTVLVTGSKHGHRLRIWEPETGTVQHLALDVTLTCLAAAGEDLVVGHDRGVLRLPLTRQ
ncbi:WD40 repeat domain-containing protein [Streptomyces sp. NPDC005574]|uniref:WD40 repeat domain-containing protein n=1 Tax=Streptomyces sp. NPDC005574 TaxID=3156891 RepID=UPI0033AD2CDA